VLLFVLVFWLCSFRNWQCVALFYCTFLLFCVYLVSLTLCFFSLTFQRTLGNFMTIAQEALNSRSASAKVSSDSFASTLCGYLRSNCSFVKDIKQDRRRKSVSDASVEAARKEKNCLKNIARRRGSTPQDRRAFYGAIKSHSRLKRIHEQAQRDKDATFQERSFLRNCYNFAKEGVAGTIGGGGDSSEFPVEVANRYYPEKYQVPVRLQQGPLSWFSYIPEDKFGYAFDMSPITPSLVRKVLS
jgi:hypothetical protein